MQTKKLPLKAKFTTTVESSKVLTNATFYVVTGNDDSLLCYDTCVELGLIPEINSVQNSVKNSLKEQYSDLFTGIGKLKDREIKLHIDENVQPVVQPHRRIPFHLRQKVEKELERMEQLDIIEKVEGSTDWVSPIVPVPKRGSSDIRITVDMRQPNKAIKRERHIMPTIDDIILRLNGANHFLGYI